MLPQKLNQFVVGGLQVMHALVHLQLPIAVALLFTPILTSAGNIQYSQSRMQHALYPVLFSPFFGLKLTAFKTGMDVIIACTL